MAKVFAIDNSIEEERRLRLLRWRAMLEQSLPGVDEGPYKRLVKEVMEELDAEARV